MEAKIIAVTNQKGGVGKTTTALALASGLRRMGYRVLEADMDPQADSSDTRRAKIKGEATMYDLLVNGATDCIQTNDGVDIISGDPALFDADKLLTGLKAPFVLRKALEVLRKEYDYIILDTPPALNIMLTNALTAADAVVIPLESGRYALKGLMKLHDTIRDIREITNPKLEVLGFLFIKHKERTQLAKAVLENLPQYEALFQTQAFKTKIRECASAGKAQAEQTDLFLYDKYCTTALDYMAFVKEVVERGRT